MNLFEKLFSKKEVQQYQEKQIKKEFESYYKLIITFTDNNKTWFDNCSTIFPISFRKFINWWTLRDSQYYQFRFNGGIACYDRNTIKRIECRKISE